MMSLKSRTLISIMLLGPTAPAFSADYDLPVVYEPPVVISEMDEYVPVEVGSGWYLRGDIGYSFSTAARGPFNYRTFAAGVYTDNTFATGSFANELSFGVGFGYRFNDLLRTDVTAENFNLRFNGTRNIALPCPGGIGTSCAVADRSEMNAWSVMVNGYVDVGTIAKFTPYVGAGVGMTYANWGTATSTYTSAGPGAIAPFTLTHAGIDSWRFTYAAMAGVAYDLNKNLKVDLGYKYRNVAGGDIFGFDTLTAAGGAVGAEARGPGFHQHEIRLGLRYELW